MRSVILNVDIIVVIEDVKSCIEGVINEIIGLVNKDVIFCDINLDNKVIDDKELEFGNMIIDV